MITTTSTDNSPQKLTNKTQDLLKKVSQDVPTLHDT